MNKAWTKQLQNQVRISRSVSVRRGPVQWEIIQSIGNSFHEQGTQRCDPIGAKRSILSMPMARSEEKELHPNARDEISQEVGVRSYRST